MQRYVEEHNLVYDSIRREITFFIKSNDTSGYQPEYYRSPCIYCPYCGTKLPASLDGAKDEYRNELEKAVGKEYCDIKPEDIPEEFKSDEWWKKRGL